MQSLCSMLSQRLRVLSIMILLVDTDVRFVTKGYPVCRDETVSGLVCVFLRSIFRICCVLFWCSFAQCPRQSADKIRATADDAAASLRSSLFQLLEERGTTLRDLSIMGWAVREEAAVSYRMKCMNGTTSSRWVCGVRSGVSFQSPVDWH